MPLLTGKTYSRAGSILTGGMVIYRACTSNRRLRLYPDSRGSAWLIKARFAGQPSQDCADDFERTPIRSAVSMTDRIMGA